MKLLWLWIALVLPVVAAEKSAETHLLRKTPNAALTADNVSAAGNYEVFKNVVVAAGKSVPLDSKLDYTPATGVSISVYCDTCGSEATSLSGLLMHAYWSVSEAPYYTAIDAALGSAFPYWDAGGIVFAVYGTQFRIMLQNTGDKDLKISQVVVWRRTP